MPRLLLCIVVTLLELLLVTFVLSLWAAIAAAYWLHSICGRIRAGTLFRGPDKVRAKHATKSADEVAPQVKHLQPHDARLMQDQPQHSVAVSS